MEEDWQSVGMELEEHVLLKAVTACSRYFCLPRNLCQEPPARLQEMLGCRKGLHCSQHFQVSGFPSLSLFLSWAGSDICDFRSKDRAAVAAVDLVVVVVQIFTLQSWMKEQLQTRPALLSAKHEAKTAPRSLVCVSCISTKLPKPRFCSCFSCLCPGSPMG